MRGSMSLMRRTVNPRDTMPRMSPCRGGSIARNDIERHACGPVAIGSSDTPLTLENTDESRNAAVTSA
jgi:hypothetical protein